MIILVVAAVFVRVTYPLARDGCRRVASRLRDWALRRPSSDLFHQLMRFAMKSIEQRSWAKFSGVHDEDERVLLVVDAGEASMRHGKSTRVVSGMATANANPSSMRHVGIDRSPPLLSEDLVLLSGSLTPKMPVTIEPSIRRWSSVGTENYDEVPNALTPTMPESAQSFLGRWITVKTENYDEFLQIFNMSW